MRFSFLARVSLILLSSCASWHPIASMVMVNDRHANGTAQDVVWIQNGLQREVFRCAQTIYGPYCVAATFTESTQFTEPAPANTQFRGQTSQRAASAGAPATAP